jgi:hypothetical protein
MSDSDLEMERMRIKSEMKWVKKKDPIERDYKTHSISLTIVALMALGGHILLKETTDYNDSSYFILALSLIFTNTILHFTHKMYQSIKSRLEVLESQLQNKK